MEVLLVYVFVVVCDASISAVGEVFLCSIASRPRGERFHLASLLAVMCLVALGSQVTKYHTSSLKLSDFSGSSSACCLAKKIGHSSSVCGEDSILLVVPVARF